MELQQDVDNRSRVNVEALGFISRVVQAAIKRGARKPRHYNHFRVQAYYLKKDKMDYRI
jgi:hypothetical protein